MTTLRVHSVLYWSVHTWKRTLSQTALHAKDTNKGMVSRSGPLGQRGNFRRDREPLGGLLGWPDSAGQMDGGQEMPRASEVR